jgi:hypothetical protein
MKTGSQVIVIGDHAPTYAGKVGTIIATASPVGQVSPAASVRFKLGEPSVWFFFYQLQIQSKNV